MKSTPIWGRPEEATKATDTELAKELRWIAYSKFHDSSFSFQALTEAARRLTKEEAADRTELEDNRGWHPEAPRANGKCQS